MTATLGSSGVLLAFIAALAGVVSVAVGIFTGRHALIRTGRAYVWLVALGATVSVVAMQVALNTHDFSLNYVARNSSRSTPRLYVISGMWGRLEGSILLWGFILAGFTVALAWRFRRRAADPLVGWATLVCLAMCAFFFGVMAGPADPFTTLANPPLDGQGPNPLLQNHPLMAFHPPMLYLGYVGFTVPFAFAIAALVTGRLGEGWLIETRRWTLIAWGFLTVGIILGSWWSYEVLGWGGFWAWDPVENASLLPWLTSTAYLHSVMVQERRGMLRVWNLSLLCSTFALTILGTFITRSGVLDSVHAFTEGSIGPLFLGCFGAIVLVTVGLIGWRGDRLRSPGAIDSPVSREGAFFINNLLFAAFAFVVLLGTVFPLVTEAVRKDRITVGRPYFDNMTMPLGLLILFFMAVAPVLPWRKASVETLRDRLQWPAVFAVAVMVVAALIGARGWAPLVAFGLGAFAAGAAVRQLILATRRHGPAGLTGRTNGGMVVHLGVVLIAVAFAASGAYAVRAEHRVKPGDVITVGGHTVRYIGSESELRQNPADPVQGILRAKLQLDGGQVYEPAITRYRFSAQGIGTPSVRTGFTEDIYTTLIEPPKAEGDPVLIGVIIQPLVLWLWIGGGLMALGTLLAVFPGARKRATDATSSAGHRVGRGRRGRSGDGDGDGAADGDGDPAGSDAGLAPDPESDDASSIDRVRVAGKR